MIALSARTFYLDDFYTRRSLLARLLAVYAR